jgi:tetratricopeptide (TPR) repeat protein
MMKRKTTPAGAANPLSRSRGGKGLLVALGLWASLSWSPGAVSRADTVELSGGKKYDDVKVLIARWDTVQYKRGTTPPTTVGGAQVLSLTRESAILARPRDKLIPAGDYQGAARSLESIGAGAEAWEIAEAKYLIGKAHALAGNAKDAAAAYKAYLEKYKSEKDWWVPSATAGLAEASLSLKQPGTAGQLFKELMTYGGQWEFRAKIGQADSLLTEKGKELEARRLYDEVARNRDAPLELRQKALVGRGKAFLLQGQPKGVIKEIGDSFFESPKPEDLAYTAERAQATLLMAKAYLSLGGKENLEQAEIWLLRVPALYANHLSAYREACDLLVDVYGKLKNTARADEWRARKQALASGPPAGSSGPEPEVGSKTGASGKEAAPPKEPSKKESGSKKPSSSKKSGSKK